MKLFKRIYYPIMAVLIVFMLVMGFVDASAGGVFQKRDKSFVTKVVRHVEEISVGNQAHNSYNERNQETVRNYITDKLYSSGSNLREYQNSTLDEDGNNVAEYARNGNELLPTVFQQKAVITQATMEKAGDDYDKTVVDKTVNNIIVAIPGSVTRAAAKAATNPTQATTSAKAVLLTAHYDSSPIGGAADAVAVGAMIENAIDAAKNGDYKNDLFFVFTDASKEGGYGARAFLNQLKGFMNGTERIEAAANFKASGNKGTLALYQSSDNDLKLMSEYAKINGGTFASSFTDILYSLTGGVSDFDALNVLNVLNFTTFGGQANYGTFNDIAENVSRSFVAQTSDVMYKFYDYFGAKDLTKLDSKSDAVFFSYLDIMTVVYPAAVAFVMAGILVGLAVAIFLVNRKKKAFSWGKALSGAFVQLLTVVATAIALFVAYYLFAFILTGFGVLTLNSLSSVIYTSGGLMISAMLFAGAIAVAFYVILKRTFAVKAIDVVRGNALLWALAAVIICFASPKISYLFAIFAILSMTVLLLTTIFRERFKKKTSMDIERLFLYVWPLVLVLPLFIPVAITAMSIVPAAFLPIVMALFVGLIGCIAPFADYLKPVLDKLAKKLPERSIRYERIVTEKVEDRAKKGKFAEVTSKKVITEKVAWNYLNRVGIAAVAAISAIMILLFSSFGGGYSTAVAYAPTYTDSIYDDSMVFVWEKDSTSKKATIEVRDQNAYKYISYMVPDFKWNGSKKAYVKDFTGLTTEVLQSTPTITRNGDVVSVQSFDTDYSQITLTLTDASSISEITFNKDNPERETETYTYEAEDKIVLELPYGYANFSFTLNEGATCNIAMEQHVFNANNLQYPGSDWEKLYDGFSGDVSVYYALRSGIVLKLSASI